MERQNTVFSTILLLASLVVSPLALAQSTQYKKKAPVKTEAPGTEQKPGQAVPQGASDKVDITELEEKYWSSKDTDFSVVQNRTYTKEKRIALTAQWGKPTSDSYNAGSVYNLGLNYYFNERNGVGIEYNSFGLANSKLVDVFVNNYGSRPNMTRHKSFAGVFYNWVPVYAKVSLLSKKILYFDMAISPGLGMTEYEQFVITGNESGSTISYCLDVTQHFFLSKNLALRFDFKNRWQKEKILKYYTSSGTTKGTLVSDDMVQSTFLMFGVQYFF